MQENRKCPRCLKSLKVSSSSRVLASFAPVLHASLEKATLCPSERTSLSPRALARLHIDIWGPISHTALSGYKYFATVTDDASRFCWLYLLKHRDEIVNYIKEFIQYLHQQFNYKVKSIVGDNAGEHQAIEALCKHEGITRDHAPPYTPRRNLLAEIKNRWLVEPLVAVLSENQLPKHLWGELLLGVNFTMTHLWHSKIMMTPYEAFYGKKPDVSGLRALGCQAWYHIPKDNRESKLSPHMAEAKLVGHTRNGDYRLYDVLSRKIVVSRNVIFSETPVKDLPTSGYDLDARPGDDIPPMDQDHTAQQRQYVPQEFLDPILWLTTLMIMLLLSVHRDRIRLFLRRLSPQTTLPRPNE